MSGHSDTVNQTGAESQSGKWSCVSWFKSMREA